MAAESLTDILQVLASAGVADMLDDSSGSAGLLSVAFACYEKAVGRVEADHWASDIPTNIPTGEVVPISPTSPACDACAAPATCRGKSGDEESSLCRSCCFRSGNCSCDWVMDTNFNPVPGRVRPISAPSTPPAPTLRSVPTPPFDEIPPDQPHDYFSFGGVCRVCGNSRDNPIHKRPC